MTSWVFRLSTKTKSGVFYILEFKHMSDVTNQYLQRTRPVTIVGSPSSDRGITQKEEDQYDFLREYMIHVKHILSSPENMSRMNEWVLISTCKQLVWSTRIGRNMPIWILCLILGSGLGADLPLEVTGTYFRAIGTWSPRSSSYRPFACQASTSRLPEPAPLTVYRSVSQVPPPLCN
jgi:hypothetical protein